MRYTTYRIKNGVTEYSCNAGYTLDLAQASRYDKLQKARYESTVNDELILELPNEYPADDTSDEAWLANAKFQIKTHLEQTKVALGFLKEKPEEVAAEAKKMLAEGMKEILREMETAK
jgi:uncharacterized protein (DUF342 family)